jgi:hypothetical protein
MIQMLLQSFEIYFEIQESEIFPARFKILRLRTVNFSNNLDEREKIKIIVQSFIIRRENNKFFQRLSDHRGVSVENRRENIHLFYLPFLKCRENNNLFFRLYVKCRENIKSVLSFSRFALFGRRSRVGTPCLIASLFATLRARFESPAAARQRCVLLRWFCGVRTCLARLVLKASSRNV